MKFCSLFSQEVITVISTLLFIMKNTCCVPHCNSRRSSVKLHRFPKTEIELEWVKYINCAKLKELSSEERHKFFVCHQHFEKRFVTKSLRLQVTAYPTLFSYQEIKTGRPSQPDYDSEHRKVCHDHDYTQTRKRKHEDHTYSKTYQTEDIELAQGYNLPPTSLVPLSIIVDQNLEMEHQHLSGDSPMMQTAKVDDKFISDCGQDIEQSTNVATPKKKRFVIRKNKLTPRCHRILKEYKKVKKQLNFATRIKRAAKFSKKDNFEKLTKSLNPLAKKILWMQISQSTKKFKGRRFTDEEKIIGLAIMKQSPNSYKFLRRIFILPSVRTINKMTSKLQIESGLNPQIFHAIKTEITSSEE